MSTSNRRARTVEQTYTKLDQREHVLIRPDTYVGSVNKRVRDRYLCYDCLVYMSAFGIYLCGFVTSFPVKNIRVHRNRRKISGFLTRASLRSARFPTCQRCTKYLTKFWLTPPTTNKEMLKEWTSKITLNKLVLGDFHTEKIHRVWASTF